MAQADDIGLYRRPARLQRDSGSRPWHRHRDAYVALVLDGGYSELGFDGRVDARPGMAIVHGPFDAHANHFYAGGARLLNLPLLPNQGANVLQVEDPDSLVRLAEVSVVEAAAALFAMAKPALAQAGDWPEALAQAIAADPSLSLAAWGAANGLAPETLSRGFRRAFGMSARRFRSAQMARRAIRALASSRDRLCDVAAACGFADQAHMTRAVRAATGATPQALRVDLTGAAPAHMDISAATSNMPSRS